MQRDPRDVADVEPQVLKEDRINVDPAERSDDAANGAIEGFYRPDLTCGVVPDELPAES